jgi:hypothetical protein
MDISLQFLIALFIPLGCIVNGGCENCDTFGRPKAGEMLISCVGLQFDGE